MSILQEAPPAAPPDPESEPPRAEHEARTRPYITPDWVNLPNPRPPDVLHVAFVLVQIVLDAALVVAAFVVAFMLRFNSDIIGGSFAPPSVETYTVMLIVTTLSVVVVFNFYGLYRLRRGYSRIDEFYKVVAAVTSALFVAIAANSFVLGDRFIYARWILAIGWLLSIVLVSLGRIAFSIAAGFLRRQGVARQRLLIIGTGVAARTVWQRILGAPSLGYEVVGFVADAGGEVDEEASHLRILGYADELAHLVRLYNVGEIVVALSGSSHADVLDIVSAVEDEQVNIRVYPDTFQLIINNDLGLNDINGLPLVSVRDVTLRGFNKVLKRGFDIVGSVIGLVLLSPLLLLVAILIKLESPGPVFFVQERVGLDGQPIQVIKFRSMRNDAESKGTWTTANDPRRTRIGRIIRRLSIDELPQLVNVLLGEMSIVGPRPEQPQYVAEFSQLIPRYMRRHKEKAGLTGWAQVNGLRGDTSIEERTRYDLYYVENWSLLLDLKIIVRTLVQIFTGHNAYLGGWKLKVWDCI